MSPDIKIPHEVVRATWDKLVAEDDKARYDALPRETELDLMIRYLKADSLYGALLDQYREAEQQLLAARRRFDMADADLAEFMVAKNPRAATAGLQSIIRRPKKP